MIFVAWAWINQKPNWGLWWSAALLRHKGWLCSFPYPFQLPAKGPARVHQLEPQNTPLIKTLPPTFLTTAPFIDSPMVVSPKSMKRRHISGEERCRQVDHPMYKFITIHAKLFQCSCWFFIMYVLRWNFSFLDSLLERLGMAAASTSLSCVVL